MAAASIASPPHREVSAPLIVGIMFLPGIFVWFLLRQGYRGNARWIGFLWAGFAALIGLQVDSTDSKPPEAQATIAQARTSPPPPSHPSPPIIGRARIDAAAATKYLALLETVENDMKAVGTIQQESDARATWGSSLGSMSAIVDAYKYGAHLRLSPAGLARRDAFMKKVVDRQTKAFPQLRKIYGQDLRQRLWEHDVEVDVHGPGNSKLRLTGFWFPSNRNIKQIADTVYQDALALRYRRLEFRSDEGGRVTYYELASLKDCDLATFSFNQWTLVN